MARPLPARLPLWMLLLLVVCLCSLAVHLYAESLGESGLSRLASNEIGGHFDDHFVLSTGLMLRPDALLVVLTAATCLPCTAIAQPPQLPPPNS